MAYIDGDDFINGAILSYQEGNRIKNNWRGAAAPANIQPGMLFSKSSNDKLYHAGAASAQEEVLQLSRSQDVSPTFLYETLLGRNLKTWWNFEDFVGGAPTTSAGRFYRFTVSGAGSNCYLGTCTIIRPGVWELATGTTTTGLGALHNMANDALRSFAFGAGVYTIEADIAITTLSTATETFTVRFGFGNVHNGDFVDGAYFEYMDAGGGSPTPNWYKCTASNSVRTKTDTGIAVSAGAWIRLKIVVNADGTSVEYFINGTSVGVVTTNIPTGMARATGIVYHIIKSAGTTDRVCDIDWIWLHVNLTTSR